MKLPQVLVHVRHAKPIEPNRGMSDIRLPLSEEGIEQAHSKALALFNELGPFDVMFHSSYLRAKQTASIFAAAQASVYGTQPYLVESRLMDERNHGAVFGFSEKEARSQFPEFYLAKERKGEFAVRFPDGECLRDVVERLIYLHTHILSHLPATRVCLFGHWGTHFGFLAAIKKMSEEDIIKLMKTNPINFCETLILNNNPTDKQAH